MILRLAVFTTLLLIGQADATTWYVSTAGSNANAGISKATAFRWPQKAFSAAKAGDTVLIEPGTYRPSAKREYGALATTDGTADAPITVRGDGGVPVLDCSGISYTSGVYCLHVTGSYWQFSDVAVTGARQADRDAWSIGIYVDAVGRPLMGVSLTRVVSHHNQGVGFRVEGAAVDVSLKNDDAHHNYDRLSGGGNADGFEFAVTGTGDTATGCRAWSNSDDGFDLYNHEYPDSAAPVTLEGDWSFRNGYVPGTTVRAGDGTGYKLGWNSAPNVLRRSLGFLNRYVAVDSNQDDRSQPGAYVIDHDTAYGDGAQEFAMDANPAITLSGNIALGRTSWLDGLPVVQAGNSWQMGGASPTDFQSTDPTGTDGPRQPDGSLPALPFLRPVPDGRLAGIGAYAP